MNDIEYSLNDAIKKRLVRDTLISFFRNASEFGQRVLEQSTILEIH